MGTIPKWARDLTPDPELTRRAEARLAELRAEEEARQAEYQRGLNEMRRVGQAYADEIEAKRRAKIEAIEAERAKAAAATVAAARQRAEADLRRNGVAEADIPRLADRAMEDWQVQQARQAAEQGDRQDRELTAYFRNRPAPRFDDLA